MEQLYVVTVLLSTCTLCFDTAYEAFLPQVVTRDQLVEGNSKLGTSSSLAEMSGPPPLAGGLILSTSAPLAVFFLQALRVVFVLFILKSQQRRKDKE